MKLTSLIAAIVLLSACTGREHGTITGGYGNAVISGEVVMQGTANASPAGVQVSVRGTGMSVMLAADGKFSFVEIPEGAELDFRRASDGIDASLRMERGATHVIVALAQNTATSSSSKRRGVGRGGDPVYEFEGLVRSATADDLVLFTSKGVEVTIALTAETVFREGDQLVTAADLFVGGRVHVKTKKVGEAFSAILVLLQTKNDRPEAREYEGTVSSVSSMQLVIVDARGNELTFVLDASTVVRLKGNTTGTVDDLESGQRVGVKASVAADGTKTATRVTIKGRK